MSFRWARLSLQGYFLSALDDISCPEFLVLGFGDQFCSRHGRNTGKRFAAETKGRNMARSSTLCILLVEWRKKALRTSSMGIPQPLSMILMNEIPPSLISTVTDVATGVNGIFH